MHACTRPTGAIFDNDAAGHEALASLKSIALPSNIRAITLPDLEFARDYPTIGPHGQSKRGHQRRPLFQSRRFSAETPLSVMVS